MTKIIVMIPKVSEEQEILHIISHNFLSKSQCITACMTAYKHLKELDECNKIKLNEVQICDRFCDMDIFQMQVLLSTIYSQLDIGNKKSAFEALLETLT